MAKITAGRCSRRFAWLSSRSAVFRIMAVLSFAAVVGIGLAARAAHDQNCSQLCKCVHRTCWESAGNGTFVDEYKCDYSSDNNCDKWWVWQGGWSADGDNAMSGQQRSYNWPEEWSCPCYFSDGGHGNRQDGGPVIPYNEPWYSASIYTYCNHCLY